jgi:hypothetical protein
MFKQVVFTLMKNDVLDAAFAHVFALVMGLK